MRLHEYQKLALRTAPEKTPVTLDYKQIQLVHCLLGLSGEIGEVVQDLENRENIIQEVGDIMWYISLGLDAIDIDFEDIEWDSKAEEHYPELTIQCAIAADVLKRHIFYGTVFHFEKFLTAIGNIMAQLLAISKTYKFTLETAMELNIQKLQKRYPEKFSKHAAVNRDVTEEEKIFRK